MSCRRGRGHTAAQLIWELVSLHSIHLQNSELSDMFYHFVTHHTASLDRQETYKPTGGAPAPVYTCCEWDDSDVLVGHWYPDWCCCVSCYSSLRKVFRAEKHSCAHLTPFKYKNIVAAFFIFELRRRLFALNDNTCTPVGK